VTVVFVLLAAGVVWAFVQMDRDPALSRLSNRVSAGLGWDFVRRVATFGALPLLTVLAAHFPSVGNAADVLAGSPTPCTQGLIS
jgi:hypothetical protein